MSGINVNINTIDEYLSCVESAYNDARDKTQTTQSIAQEIYDRARSALEKAEEALNMMLQEEEMAKETLEHDKEVLEELYRQHEATEKAKYEAWDMVCAAGNAYRSASAAYTSAKNASSGSTPEEKKAHNDTVKSASDALKTAKANYSQAQEYYNKLCQRLIELKSAISNAQSVIQSLEYLLQRLSADIVKAREYCRSVADSLNRLARESREFSETAQKVLSGLNTCYNGAAEARGCVYDAVKALCSAGGYEVSFSKTVRMSDTKCLETMYKRLDNTSLSIEQSCDGLERHTDIYYESMNDSISQAAVEKAREIHSGVSKKREMIIGIRNDLQTAKSQLDAYLSHAGMFL